MAEKKKRTRKSTKKADYDAMLLKAVNDALGGYRKANWEMQLRILAIQLLLQEQGLMTAGDVETKFEELRKRFQPTQRAFEAEMRRILESYDGPKQ
jgi:hypothetical protein